MRGTFGEAPYLVNHQTDDLVPLCSNPTKCECQPRRHMYPSVPPLAPSNITLTRIHGIYTSLEPVSWNKGASPRQLAASPHN
ncbi:hypothetical protein M405DRAFT_813971 [Rhizopogon salebrosus TDB-379]|nr:hypothetical protein M405DRAFT_813971 [Rhizopogon salebrosus TDB-379]